MSADLQHVTRAEPLLQLARALLVHAGGDGESGQIVAESLVEADLRGITSHGVMRLPGYIELIHDGTIRPRARPSVERADGSTVVVAGNRSFGQLAARTATALAVEKAGEAGVAVATLSGVHHVGRLGEYAELAAGENCISLVFVNCGQPGGLVAPFGGRSRLFGTNPLALGIPGDGKPPIICDFSTASATDGRVRLLYEADQDAPEGWLVDSRGRATMRPGDLYDGGAILPAAAHKGFGLGLFIEILGGALAGAGCASIGDDPGNGCVMIVIDPERFASASAFGSIVDRVIETVESSPPAEGVERVIVPGTIEREAEVRRRTAGIPVAPETWRQLAELSERASVPFDLST